VNEQDYSKGTTSIAQAIAEATDTNFVPVTFEQYEHVDGPFFHGTKTQFEIGDELVPGHPSNYQQGRRSNYVYFSALIEPAVWAAELASALSASDEPGRIYVVAPTGPFEDDLNVTNKKFPGNVTQSYRTRHPMRVVDELHIWEGHSPEVLQVMLDNLGQQGLDVIED
jgi:hypothetical protein